MVVDTTQLGAFLFALLALVGSPGPATLALAATGAAFGARAARGFLAGALCGAALSITLVGSGVTGALLAFPGVAPTLLGCASLYLLYLTYRIATAPPLGQQATSAQAPGFGAGFLLAITNPKGYAVFATLFSGFMLIPEKPLADTLFKGSLLMLLLILIDTAWLLIGGALRRLLSDPLVARRVNYAFAAMLLISVALALAW